MKSTESETISDEVSELVPLPSHPSVSPPPVRVQSQASSSELGKQLAEVESLLQKQDLLDARISAHGETIVAIGGAALKVRH